MDNNEIKRNRSESFNIAFVIKILTLKDFYFKWNVVQKGVLPPSTWNVVQKGLETQVLYDAKL